MQNVLTIAGSDSLAGGGIQADLKTFEELDVFGLSATTSIANIFPHEVSIHNLTPEILAEQLDSIFGQVKTTAAKTGLVGSVKMIEVVAEQLKKHPTTLVVDPVFFLKEGQMDSKNDYVEATIQQLLPLATITTPNLLEAQALSGVTISEVEDLPIAAKKIQALGCSNVVIKGGSRLSGNEAVDYLLTPDGEFWFKTPKIPNATINGAGCTFSAAITAFLAREYPVEKAVQAAKFFVQDAILQGVKIGKNSGSVYQGASRNQEDNHAKK